MVGPDSWLLLLFAFAFVAMWLAVTAALARQSGWNRLAERYPDRDQIPLRRLRMASARMNRVTFNGALTIDICPGGLRFSLWRIFGLFQSPFLVPYAEITVSEQRMLFLRMISLSCGPGPVATILINQRTFDQIAAASPLRMPEAAG